MGLTRRAEIGLDAEVKLHDACLEPRAAALCQLWRLGELGEAEHARVEGARRCLAAGRHGDLNMVDGADAHVARAMAYRAQKRSMRLPLMPRLSSQNLRLRMSMPKAFPRSAAEASPVEA